MADHYLLGKQSLPHVTLCQFQANETDIQSVWDEVCGSIEKTAIELSFNDFSRITFDNATYWASLLPDHLDVLASKTITAAAIGSGLNQMRFIGVFKNIQRNTGESTSENSLTFGLSILF